MRGLKTLIRIRREALDARRRRLVALETQRDQVDRQLVALADQLVAEQTTAAKDPVYLMTYEGFLRQVDQERERLTQRRETLVRDIARASDEIALAFSEVKKFEIALERRVRREAAEAARREDLELEEIGLTGFRQRQNRAVGTS